MRPFPMRFDYLARRALGRRSTDIKGQGHGSDLEGQQHGCRTRPRLAESYRSPG